MQIPPKNIQAKDEAMTNHLRDTQRDFKDDRKTRNALTDLQKTVNEYPKKHPSGSHRSVPEHRRRRPRTPKGAPQSHPGAKVDFAREGAHFQPPGRGN